MTTSASARQALCFRSMVAMSNALLTSEYDIRVEPDAEGQIHLTTHAALADVLYLEKFPGHGGQRGDLLRIRRGQPSRHTAPGGDRPEVHRNSTVSAVLPAGGHVTGRWAVHHARRADRPPAIQSESHDAYRSGRPEHDVGPAGP